MNTQGTQQKKLLTPENLEILQSFDDGASGYFFKMYGYLMDCIEDGVSSGRFSQEEAEQDVEIALWYAFACNNIDEYEYYYKAAEWMKGSETNAHGCGTWYYRYSVALMYCGRLEEALRYAEQGARQEPDYPWVFLQVAKLRSHFSDKNGALQAAAQGLALVPGDYEFLMLQKEIEEEKALEEMEYHWIDPACDHLLQEGLAEEADEKQRAIAGIVVDSDGLRQVKEIFHSQEYEADWPYCSFCVSARGRLLNYVFRMNQAALSKLNPDWIRLQKEKIETGRYWNYKDEEGVNHSLWSVVIDLDYSITLFYGDGEESLQIPIEEMRQSFKCK